MFNLNMLRLRMENQIFSYVDGTRLSQYKGTRRGDVNNHIKEKAVKPKNLCFGVQDSTILGLNTGAINDILLLTFL